MLVRGSILVDDSPVEQYFMSNPPAFFVTSNKDSIALPKGTPVAVHSSGTGFIRATNTAIGTMAYGVLAEDATIGVGVSVLVQGTIVLTNWNTIAGIPNLSPRAIYYLGTAGHLTSTAPTTPGVIVQAIGRAISPVALELIFDSPILL